MNPSELLKTGNLEFYARQVVEGFITGLHKSPFHGFSVEFAEHRQYNTGEPVKNIDWKLYARSGRYYVKRYEEETNLRCRILLDISPSMYYPVESKAKLKFSVLAAASLMELLKKQRDALGLTLFADKIIDHTDVRSSSAHHKFLIQQLENVLEREPEMGATDITETLHQIAERIPRRSMVVLFTDMLENVEKSDKLFEALQHLKFNKHEVVLFHVSDKSTELDFEFENRPYKFVDVESGNQMKLYPSEIKTAYLEKMDQFYKELKSRCAQYQIEFVETDTALNLEQVLLPFLVKRQKQF